MSSIVASAHAHSSSEQYIRRIYRRVKEWQEGRIEVRLERRYLLGFHTFCIHGHLHVSPVNVHPTQKCRPWCCFHTPCNISLIYNYIRKVWNTDHRLIVSELTYHLGRLYSYYLLHTMHFWWL